MMIEFYYVYRAQKYAQMYLLAQFKFHYFFFFGTNNQWRLEVLPL